jgi:general stress protein 26
MKRTQLPKELRELLYRLPYATIATVCPDGQPWNTPVFARGDDELNLYWVSHKQAQHSLNIARQPRIFVVIYDSMVPEGEGLGLYLAMRA